jgi:hydroxyethylthiazole kinase
MVEKINKIRNNVKNKSPLIHSITNPISINQCANAVLALGARPIMAEHPDEVREITKTAHSLLINMGNITDTRMKAMMISAQTAKENNIPIVLDSVGVACSDLRKNFVHGLIKNYNISVIKGNYSEIMALYDDAYNTAGVDTDKALRIEDLDKTAVELSKKFNTIILASGKTDIVTDGERLVHINNGTPMLSQITGTGCMLGCLVACYLSVSRDMDAAVAACSVLGICGELSETHKGNGSFAVNLMDKLSTLTDKDIEKRLKMEEICFE